MKTEWIIEQIIQEEFAACEAAWEACPEAKWAWCCDPDYARVEPLIGPWTEHLSYLRYVYPYREDADQADQVARIRNFRPVRVAVPPKVGKAMAELDKARAEMYKARDEWDKACDEYKKTCDKWTDDDAKVNAARDELRKASDEWHKAYDKRKKAGDEWADENHDKDWPDNTWDKTKNKLKVNRIKVNKTIKTKMEQKYYNIYEQYLADSSPEDTTIEFINNKYTLVSPDKWSKLIMEPLTFDTKIEAIGELINNIKPRT